MLGQWEVVAILVVALLIFGPAQLPKLAKSIGTSIRSFKQGVKDAAGDDDEPASAKHVPTDEAEKKKLPNKPRHA
jgi:sec-independent protein translocase protein TatA